VNRHPAWRQQPSAHLAAEKVFSSIERFLQVEAVSGMVLLTAAAAALLWANSPAADSYHQFWHAPVTLGVGSLVLVQPLEFWINDGLMTIFFLVVGLEIRREIHEGALAGVRRAALPLAAALGGVVVPALIYLALNGGSGLSRGWAVPTATDIAFAVGVLALLGKMVHPAVRVLLLALAVIDDMAAVVVIAVFYSEGIQIFGLLIAASGVLLVLAFQQFGFRLAIAYVAPGAVVWLGLLQAGIHPTLAGVILGLLTPVTALHRGELPVQTAANALRDYDRRAHTSNRDMHELVPPLRQLKRAQRELLPPVVRVQLALHPWVAYAVMPLFALANAGITLQNTGFADGASRTVALGVLVALVVGKPLGILGASWMAARLGWCRLPVGVNWGAVTLVGLLGGIGFTMAIFIATLAFPDETLLNAAKLGVLVASAASGMLGLALGRRLLKRRSPIHSVEDRNRPSGPTSQDRGG
jgi:Na+:H+ antiporter, NhaA family